LEFDKLLTVKADDAQACGGPPEVAPAPGEHASLHGLLRWEEGEHVVEDAVGEVADAVGGGHRRYTVLLLPRRHSVEQVAGVVGAARQEMLINDARVEKMGCDRKMHALRRRGLTYGRRRQVRLAGGREEDTVAALVGRCSVVRLRATERKMSVAEHHPQLLHLNIYFLLQEIYLSTPAKRLSCSRKFIHIQ
jgi:hypothetical protein